MVCVGFTTHTVCRTSLVSTVLLSFFLVFNSLVPLIIKLIIEPIVKTFHKVVIPLRIIVTLEAGDSPIPPFICLFLYFILSNIFSLLYHLPLLSVSGST